MYFVFYLFSMNQNLYLFFINRYINIKSNDFYLIYYYAWFKKFSIEAHFLVKNVFTDKK